ncbi:MAG: tetratricopeptide repeat protein, partial [Thermoanaerobaculia bacterium]|nr:tetratricopeptide repeat protein [Thermoanaerobaculia bacterium]
MRRALASLTDVETAHPDLEIDLAIDLSIALGQQSDYAEAEALLIRSEESLQAALGPARTYRLARARSLTLLYAGDVLGALEQGERALAAAERTGDEHRRAAALLHLAQAENRLHDYASALDRLRRVLEIEQRPLHRAIALLETGICQLELNRLDQAHTTFERALELARELGHDRLEGVLLGELGLVEAKRGRSEAAIALFDRA